MATTVTYKGSTLTTLTNETKTLKTSGKYMEDDVTIQDVSSGSAAIGIVDEPDAAGGTIRHITAVDLSADTVQPSYLLQGYTAHNAAGSSIVGTYQGGGGTPTLQSKSVSFTPSETAISSTVTSDAGYDGLSQVSVSVAAISSDYVGSNIPTRSSTDLSKNGATVTAPAGYYANSAVATISSGSATIPTTIIAVTPGINVSNNGLISVSVSSSSNVTPTVSAGYVSSGTAGSVSVSGSSSSQLSTQAAATITPTESQQTAVASGKFTTGAINVAGISSDYVGSSITRRSSTDMSKDGATVTAPAGYYASAATTTIGSGTVTAPSSISATGATVTTGTNTVTFSKSVSVTPSVTTAGYISSGTAGNATVSLTASMSTKAAATITPGTSDQTIASQQYLTGVQTISGDANLVAGNIKSGTSIFGVTGSYTGGTAAISVVTEQLSGGGEAKIITALDISDTTASASDVASGKYFYTASGVKTAGTASGGGGGSVSYGTFTASNTMNTNNIYVMTYENPATSVFPDKVPVVMRVVYNTTKTYTSVIESDGYMYVALVGTSDAYWPTATATSGTATLVYSVSVNSSSILGTFPHGTFVWYKVSPNAVLSVSYYNNN